MSPVHNDGGESNFGFPLPMPKCAFSWSIGSWKSKSALSSQTMGSQTLRRVVVSWSFPSLSRPTKEMHVVSGAGSLIGEMFLTRVCEPPILFAEIFALESMSFVQALGFPPNRSVSSGAT